MRSMCLRLIWKRASGLLSPDSGNGRLLVRNSDAYVWKRGATGWKFPWLSQDVEPLGLTVTGCRARVVGGDRFYRHGR